MPNNFIKTGLLVTNNLINNSILKLELMIDEIKREVVDQDLVIQALKKFAEVFDDAPPYRQKELIQSVMKNAFISRDSIKIALYGRQPDIRQIEPKKAQEILRSGLPDWLARVDTKRSSQPLEIQLLVKLYKKRKRGFQLSLDTPFSSDS